MKEVGIAAVAAVALIGWAFLAYYVHDVWGPRLVQLLVRKLRGHA